MKVAVITDTHFGIRGDAHVFLDHQELFYRDTFFPYLKEHNITTLLHLGDLFDRRKYINFATLRRTREMFLDRLAEENIKVYSIVGNHDTAYKNTNEVNSMDLLLKEYTNYEVYYNDPVVITLDGCDIMLSPWICQNNSDASFEAFKATSAKILMGHFEFAGFEMMKGQLATHGIDSSEFKKFDTVYSGHYHHPSASGNVVYLGAPYEMTWTDYAGKRGFHIFDTQTLEMDFVPNPNKIFHKIEYDDSDLSVEDLEELDVSSLTNTYVKVIVNKKSNAYVYDMFIDKLEAAGCADITVVEGNADVDFSSDTDVVDEAQDTLSLLNAFTDKLDLKKNKAKVNNFLHELYHEAISV